MSARYRRVPKHPAADLGEEVTVLQMESETFYSMSGVGRVIWDQLENGATLAELEDALLARYEVDADTCRRDVSVFLDQLEAVGLVARE